MLNLFKLVVIFSNVAKFSYKDVAVMISVRSDNSLICIGAVL